MSAKLLCAVAFAGIAFQCALAQDPTKVEPKHYKLAFENEWVQVVSVHYGPHEKSGMHDHPGGVVVVITSGHLRFTDQDGNVREVYAKPGESRWFPAFKHKVENLGDTAYNAVYVGIKTKASSANAGAKDAQPALEGQIAKIVDDYVLAAQGDFPAQAELGTKHPRE
jgi:beta-alanine degradation protein BauB